MAKFVCPSCDYVYDEEKGDPREGWAPGTPFAEIDPDWPCPDCGVREQVDFEPHPEEKS
jgi:rubredoxin